MRPCGGLSTRVLWPTTIAASGRIGGSGVTVTKAIIDGQTGRVGGNGHRRYGSDGSAAVGTLL